MAMMRVEVERGVELHVQDLGAGRPVVLIAGFGLDHEVWDAQVRLLTGAGLRTICIDQRGHGSSDKPLGGYEVERLAEDAAAVLDTLDLEHCAAFVLYEIEGESCDAIASAFEVPVGTVYSRLHHARRRFIDAYSNLSRSSSERPRLAGGT